MSVIFKARVLWVLPVAVVGSWMAVRTLAASTMARAHEPALVAAVAVAAPIGPEIKDAALVRLISRHANAAVAARN